MLNLIKANIYRLVNSKVFRNAFIIVGILILLTICGPKIFDGSIYFIHFDTLERSFGFVFNAFRDSAAPTAGEMVRSALGFIPVIFIMIMYFVEEFISRPYQNGTLKNTIAYGYNRKQVYLTKLVIISLTIVSLLFVLVGGTAVISMMIPSVRETMNLQLIGVMTQFTLLVALCLVASTSIIVFLGTIIKKSSVMVMVTICLFMVSATFVPETYRLGESILVSYNPFFLLMDICLKRPDQSTVIFIIIVCTGEIILSSLLGCAVFEEQEIH